MENVEQVVSTLHVILQCRIYKLAARPWHQSSVTHLKRNAVRIISPYDNRAPESLTNTDKTEHKESVLFPNLTLGSLTNSHATRNTMKIIEI